MSIKAIRAAFAHCAFTGLSRNHLGLLLTELQPAWTAAREDRLHTRRTRPRIRKAGAGRRPRLSFTDRVVITLVHLRLAIPHAALAVAYHVDRSTVTRAVTQIRPLLARRGFATPTGTRLHTAATDHMGTRPQTPVLTTDRRRTHHRRTEMVARPTTLHRPPRTPPRNHQRHRRPRLRQIRRPHLVNTQATHHQLLRTRSLLIR
ncbi:helix-turn-helix domain-containing protein [Micromonospora sp. CPCC 206061]|uniref:helix-turn-helix domain-containing protein n=1 Tax=Micromonospora sp. CPCC 206061 TaxID=3122410 RepID=UPI003FA5759B